MQDGNDSGRKSGRRCVVWHREGEVSSALVDALTSRGMRVETSRSAHEVLGIGCVEQRRGPGLIVVLDGDGISLVDQGRVLEGMERFCPSGLVWVYQEGANPPLRGYVGMEKAGEEAGSVSGVVSGVVSGGDSGAPERVDVDGGGPLASSPGGAGKMRLTGDGEGGRAIRASDVLDGDELAALLGRDDSLRSP